MATNITPSSTQALILMSLTTFFFHEHGLNFPEDGIYTLKKRLNETPTRVLLASIEGWTMLFPSRRDAGYHAVNLLSR
jgi:hypothetical protein